MEGSANETVIMVHGTWAAPDPAKSRWYQPTQPFTAKLDAALQERGSPARCWAHCRQGNQIFHWGDNSWRDNDWITRTRAASALANYVAKLMNEGWQCHIIAHSHGGNIVLEALPDIMAVPNANRSLGKIVTLGTPFMDMMSPIHKRMNLQDKVMKIGSLSAAAYGSSLFLLH